MAKYQRITLFLIHLLPIEFGFIFVYRMQPTDKKTTFFGVLCVVRYLLVDIVLMNILPHTFDLFT